MKVLITDYAWPDLKVETGVIESAGFELVAGPAVAGNEEEIERLVAEHDPDAILTCWAPVSARAITSATRLKIVARLGVGLDNIDVGAACAVGAWVTNVPDYCVEEVSDHALALLLNHFRAIAGYDRDVKEGRWAPGSRPLKRIAELTVGIIGYGRIGRASGRKLAAFGCTVLATNGDYPVTAEAGVQAATVEDIQNSADAIILHVPLTNETHHLVDESFISACKHKPLLINVSRGGLVSNEAILDALADGRLSGAALDVVEGEPSPSAKVIGHANVTATPHVAFLSDTSVIELRARACEEVVRVLSGKDPVNACNRLQNGQSLPGGVASDIRVIQTVQGSIVVKKALDKLKVAADWRSDPARSLTEVAALNAATELLGPGVVPRVLWSDGVRNQFAMELVSSTQKNWKQELLAGTVNLATARRVGELLGMLHKRSSTCPALAERFADQTFFRELRVTPYFERVAQRNPEYRDAVSTVIEGVTTRRQALVHGDYSPKNLLVDDATVTVVDWEVAHWGDPRFDVAFVLAHLILKAHRREAKMNELLLAERSFVDGYRVEGPAVFDAHLLPLLGCLLLARLDSDSPVDYIAELDTGGIRRIAHTLLSEDMTFANRWFN
ncbi:NAD(P)-dependent oxidoreductase [Paraburkholderia sediminicola]|uniref:NAD(P)-dependent oxidoreductase n=1 Tax=Paraburkholderia sediminicola TaxID=458836 RepID=UPI0038B79A63